MKKKIQRSNKWEPRVSSILFCTYHKQNETELHQPFNLTILLDMPDASDATVFQDVA